MYSSKSQLSLKKKKSSQDEKVYRIYGKVKPESKSPTTFSDIGADAQALILKHAGVRKPISKSTNRPYIQDDLWANYSKTLNIRELIDKLSNAVRTYNMRAFKILVEANKERIKKMTIHIIVLRDCILRDYRDMFKYLIRELNVSTDDLGLLMREISALRRDEIFRIMMNYVYGSNINIPTSPFLEKLVYHITRDGNYYMLKEILKRVPAKSINRVYLCSYARTIIKGMRILPDDDVVALLNKSC